MFEQLGFLQRAYICYQQDMEVLQELQHQWESGCEKDPTRLLGQSTRLKSIISTMTAREKNPCSRLQTVFRAHLSGMV